MSEEYKVLKIVTGEYIFGRQVKKYSDGSLVLSDPRILFIKPDKSLELFPYCIYSGDEEYTFSIDVIVTVSSALPDLTKDYLDGMYGKKGSIH